MKTKFTFVFQLEGGWTVDAGSMIVYDHTSRRISIQVTLQRPGCYRAHLTYCNTTLTNGNFDIIVLTSKCNYLVVETCQFHCILIQKSFHL